MTVFFCSSCGATVPEQNLKTGTAVRVNANTVHCFDCVTKRLAPVSDDQIRRALLAKQTEGTLKRAVKSISRRLIAQLPEGKFQRVVRRVSERILRTGEFRRVGSSPRYRAPGTATTVAQVAKKRTEAQNLAYASIACVVLAIGTLILYIGMSKKSAPENETASAPPAPAAVAPVQSATKAVAAVPVQPIAKSVTPAPVATAPAVARSTDTVAIAPTTEKVVIPPLLTERAAPNEPTVDFRAQIAQDRLSEAQQFHAEHPQEIGAYQKKLGDIVHIYRNTAAATEAAQLIENVSKHIAPPKPSTALGWLSDWQVDNLEQHAKVQMYEQFDGQKEVLETLPPKVGDALRLKRKVLVPHDTAILQIDVRATENGASEVGIEVNGQATPRQNIQGAGWQSFAVDLSAHKGQEVAVTIFSGANDKIQPAYIREPKFIAKASKSVSLLSLMTPDAARAANASWQNSVSLLGQADPMKDSVAGTWKNENGTLSCDATQNARIALPYRPGEEYDLRVRFTRVDGNDAVVLLLPHGKTAVGFTIGAWNNTVCGFETVAGVSAAANSTTVKKAAWLENGKTYTVVIQIRNDGLKAFLNDLPITELKTDFSDVAVAADWKMNDATLPALGSWRNQVVFHSAEILELKGKGSSARENEKIADIKVEYEKALLEAYKLLGEKGARAAVERLEGARKNAAMAPLSARLQQDSDCVALALDVRGTIASGAAKLVDGRGYTLIKADGKEVSVGKDSGSVVKAVSNDTISIEQNLQGVSAVLKLTLDELAPKTQRDLLLMGCSSSAEASMKLALLAMPQLFGNDVEGAQQQIRQRLESARADSSYADRADKLAAHAALIEKHLAAEKRAAHIAALAKEGKWREAKTELDAFKAEYLNTYAYEKAKSTLDPLIPTIEKESVSPLLKR